MPHLWPDHKNFLQATLYEKVRFAIFQQELQNSTMFDGLLRFRISEKWANLLLPLNIQKQKVFQRQGGFALLTPQPGALPLDPAYRLALRALAMPPFAKSSIRHCTGIFLLRQHQYWSCSVSEQKQKISIRKTPTVDLEWVKIGRVISGVSGPKFTHFLFSAGIIKCT